MSEPGSRVRWGDGCGFHLGVLLLTCVLFVINGMMAGVLFVRLRPLLPEWAARPRYAQLFILAVPIALIFVEWFVIDWFSSRLRQRSKPSSQPRRDVSR